MTDNTGKTDDIKIDEDVISPVISEEEEELRRQRRAERRARMRREKERIERINRLVRLAAVPAVCVVCVIIMIFIGVGIAHKNSVQAETGQTDAGKTAKAQEATVPQDTSEDTASPLPTPQIADDKIQVGEVEFMAGMEAKSTSLTNNNITSDVYSGHTILINESDNTIVAARDANTKIYPASMTKVLTVLVAAEHVTDLDDEFTITIDITDYAYVNDCSAVGFLDEETVTVRDLFYGTILPSGGDAALGLATYVAGSQEAFVEMMNDKLEELGLSDTAHFTNCVGLYDDDHYCTTYDMAIMMKAAMENDLCREVLSAHTYTTSSTAQHPEGITISNWFLRRIEDKDSGGLVLCGKTGFVNQSGSCAVSYFISDSGEPYICVTADTYSSWRCIYDHVEMYKTYAD